MAGIDGVDPRRVWTEPLVAWLRRSEISPDRSRRTVSAFERFSVWTIKRGLGADDVDEGLIDDYITAEQQRSGSLVPAAAQYLPVVKRFLAAEDVFVLRGPASRSRDGLPRLTGGPLDEVVVDLVAWLKRERYARGTAVSVACTAARLNMWMGSRRLGIPDLDEAMLARFVVSQSRGPRRRPSSAPRMTRVGKFLTVAGLLTPTPSPGPATAAEQLLDEWAAFLSGRGLSDGWIHEMRGWAERFVTGLAVGPDATLSWDGVDVSAVNCYLAQRGQGYSLSSRRHLVSTMRSLLDWALLTGRVQRSMSAGVLRPARGAPPLPRVLIPEQVRALIAAADLSTAEGRRDRAIAVLISRLGLRAGEVATMSLDDLDWHTGTVTVHGKGARVLTLPIPDDVGQAMVAYLRDGRPPAVRDRSVFIRLRPPLARLTAKGVSGVVARLAASAGLGIVHAHVLRHTRSDRGAGRRWLFDRGPRTAGACPHRHHHDLCPH